MSSDANATASDANLPSLSALVVICFDQRRGNTVVWQRAADGSALVELDDGIEYRALPAGLHTVESDLIYFIHRDQAGLSAFENIPDSDAKRHASFYAVAGLTPREGTRLGKLWLHAPRLQALSTSLRDALLNHSEPSRDTASSSSSLLNENASRKLEEYWHQHRRQPDLNASPSNSQQPESHSAPTQRKRQRGLSESIPFVDSPNSHPANSLSLLFDSVGPLIFQLYRQSLLRKRILLLRKPPLHHLCDFVYLLSILSSIPNLIAEDLPGGGISLDPRFNIGIYDILDLESRAKGPESSERAVEGYIACTSDELLATKPHLFDIKVQFPPPDSQQTWPTMTTSSGAPIKATQRDLRHYRALRLRIHKLYEPNAATDADPNEDAVDDSESATLLNNQESNEFSDTYSIPNESFIAEPVPWAAIAYDSFIWWASAGERDADFQEERDFDTDLLDAAFTERPQSPLQHRRNMSAGRASAGENFEMSVVAYFQRLTTLMVERVGECIPSDSESGSDSEGEDGGPDQEGFVAKEDLIRMGLDVWSHSDRLFVEELARVYWNRNVEVQGATVECCGVRLL